MLSQVIQGIYISSLLSSLGGLVHGYSTRVMGDMRESDSRQEFLHKLTDVPAFLIWLRQTHDAKVRIIDARDRKNIIEGTDAAVMRSVGDQNPKVFLGVHVADCVPLLMVDPEARVVGAAHAGWRGTLKAIAAKTIEKMKFLGANPANIRVSIGPHIGRCCYSVEKDRAGQFNRVFGENPCLVSLNRGAWYLDLGYANFLQLVASGVTPERIDGHPTCTSCQNKEFFSYRRNRLDGYGEILGVVGFS